jgi:hypothetical protein
MREPDERFGTGVDPEDPGARAWKLAATARESGASGTEELQRHVSPARLRSWSQPRALGGLGEILSVASAGEARLPAPIGDGREQATR